MYQCRFYTCVINRKTLSKIISIATGVPQHKHTQKELFAFADKIYSKQDTDTRKLRFLYNHSGIDYRYSVLPDFNVANEERVFFSTNNDLQPVPDIGKRMEVYNKFAADLSVNTIKNCIKGKIESKEITHLITVSCTGMSAPGLDLQIMEQMQLPKNIVRTSVNFMGCYAAIHAMKMADAFCNNDKNANVIIVCTEFCTLHFQTDATIDNLTSSLLFADGCAALLMQHNDAGKGLLLENFYSDVNFSGKEDMSWSLSTNGFLMTLSGYVPELIKADFENLVATALQQTNRKKENVTSWAIHPGGKKILDTIQQQMQLEVNALQQSYEVLKDYGNMSSPTVLFVLQKIMHNIQNEDTKNAIVFGAAFGPGLTMETFTATYA
jgi:predicted naringenin-chalcone synthase